MELSTQAKCLQMTICPRLISLSCDRFEIFTKIAPKGHQVSQWDYLTELAQLLPKLTLRPLSPQDYVAVQQTVQGLGNSLRFWVRWDLP